MTTLQITDPEERAEGTSSVSLTADTFPSRGRLGGTSSQPSPEAVIAPFGREVEDLRRTLNQNYAEGSVLLTVSDSENSDKDGETFDDLLADVVAGLEGMDALSVGLLIMRMGIWLEEPTYENRASLAAAARLLAKQMAKNEP